MHRKNATGTYDVIHLETESGLVLRSDGTTVEQAITDLTPTVGESVPKTLKTGRIFVNTETGSIYIGNAENEPVEVTGMGNIDLSNVSIANIQTISGMTMSEILNRMKSLGIGISGDNYTIRDYSDIITGNIVSGAEVTMGGYSWIVTSIQPSERVFYMISKDVISKCKFRNSGGTYPSSTLATTAKDFAATLPSNVQDALIVRSSGGISQKCHAPTFEQITTWFTEDSSRIAMYDSVACKYWLCDNGYTESNMSTSISTSHALIVNTTGDCSKRTNWASNNAIQESVTSTQGFRAVVALMM